jgi:hypothetical protein
MNFTVVRPVRERSADAPSEKLQLLVQSAALPIAAAAMDLPYADRVVRLDFISGDFPRTIPGALD